MSKEVYRHLRGELSPEDFESERRPAERMSLTELARQRRVSPAA
jgi:hypothetical protein